MSEAKNSSGQPFRIITIDQVLKEIQPYNHFELHPHSTDTPNIRDHWRRMPDGIHWQKVMRRVHMSNPRNWWDIAQHLTLLPDGLFVTGRSYRRTPASIAGFNGRAPDRIPLMVEMIGNFNPGIDVLEGAQRRAILRLTRTFLDQGKFIRFHNEHSAKTCPGRLIDRGEFLQEAARLKIDGEEGAQMQGTVTAPLGLRVRSMPGTQYRQIGSLQHGTRIVIIQSANHAWWQIRYGAGIGYVHKDWVRIEAESEAGLSARVRQLEGENRALHARLSSTAAKLEQVVADLRG